MSYALAFWILMLVWLVFGAMTTDREKGWQGWGGTLLHFILLLLLGLQVFGRAIHG
jgi:hypothetical protein